MSRFENDVIDSAKRILAEEASCAIIKDFATPGECAELACGSQPDSPGVFADADISTLYRLFPVIHNIDELVATWSQTANMYGYTALAGISHAVKRGGGIRPHVDGPTIEDDGSHKLYGPITASLRVDTNDDVERTVIVNAWPSKGACLENGHPTDRYIKFEPNRSRLFVEHFKSWIHSRSFSQEPGDLLLLRGHPRPVRHAMSQYGQTQQIIFGYQLSGHGNAYERQKALHDEEHAKSPRTRWGVSEWPM